MIILFTMDEEDISLDLFFIAAILSLDLFFIAALDYTRTLFLAFAKYQYIYLILSFKSVHLFNHRKQIFYLLDLFLELR